MSPSRSRYDEQDMMRLQQEAIARVREMQARARKTVEHANSWASASHPMIDTTQGHRPGSQPHSQQQVVYDSPAPPIPSPHSHSGQLIPTALAPLKKNGLLGLLNFSQIDSELIILIGVALLLIQQEDVDITLLLALAYIML